MEIIDLQFVLAQAEIAVFGCLRRGFGIEISHWWKIVAFVCRSIVPGTALNV